MNLKKLVLNWKISGEHSIELGDENDQKVEIKKLKEFDQQLLKDFFLRFGGKYNSKKNNFTFPKVNNSEELRILMEKVCQDIYDNIGEPEQKKEKVLETVFTVEEQEEEEPNPPFEQAAKVVEIISELDETSKLCDQMSNLLRYEGKTSADWILNPFAKNGRIIQSLQRVYPGVKVGFLESDKMKVERLLELSDKENPVSHLDFKVFLDLKTPALGGQPGCCIHARDRIIMALSANDSDLNKEDNITINFSYIRHAYKLLNEGGRLVVLMPRFKSLILPELEEHFYNWLEGETDYYKFVDPNSKDFSENFIILVIDK